MNLFGGKSKILGLLFILAAFASFYLGDILTFPVSKKWMAGMILVVAVLFIALFVLRPKKTEQDVIAEEDERNQYIELKCAAAACRAAQYASFVAMISGMIGFGLTREYAFIWLVMGGILPYGTSRIAYLISAFRYDKP
jgi:hypothetical protein